jgi:murein DD-endopeptidase MepM/ murein hydrolase activator NlpD
LDFVSADGLEHIALVGISAIATPGPEKVSIRVQAEDGQQIALVTRLNVVAGRFSHEVLRFSPTVARLLDPKITEAEQKRLSEVYATSNAQILWQGVFAWPCTGEITSEFGTRRGYEDREGSYHAGIDISGNIGDIVRAPAAGVVVLAEKLQVRGNAVIIDHGAGVFSSYCHLERIEVQVGQAIRPGDILGRVGATGLVTGAHLHWELRVGGVAVDPREWTTRRFP